MSEFAKPRDNSSVPNLPKNDLPVLEAVSLDFSNSANYVNRTMRYVIYIPELKDGGEPLVFPEGTPKAGLPIKTLEDGKTPDRGIVFYNGKDSVWQAVRGTGKEVILITGVEGEHARLLDIEEKRLLEGTSSHTLDTAKALLTYAKDTLGLIDAQNKKQASVEKEMGPIEGSCAHHMIVTKENLHRAVYVPTGFVFRDGPVDQQTYPKGAVIISSGRHAWGVDKDIFIRWFKRSEEGQEIALASLEDEFKVG